METRFDQRYLLSWAELDHLAHAELNSPSVANPSTKIQIPIHWPDRRPLSPVFLAQSIPKPPNPASHLCTKLIPHFSFIPPLLNSRVTSGSLVSTRWRTCSIIFLIYIQAGHKGWPLLSFQEVHLILDYCQMHPLTNAQCVYTFCSTILLYLKLLQGYNRSYSQDFGVFCPKSCIWHRGIIERKSRI